MIRNCRIIGADTISEPMDIRIENGIISDIGHFEDSDGYDANGNYVSAGFIDIHTHGGNCSDFMDATDDAFDNVLKYHLRNGTTDVLATSLTASREQIGRSLSDYMLRLRQSVLQGRCMGFFILTQRAMQ